MRINTNITSLNTFNSYTSANNKIADSVAKLSSGYAINSAADNAAGLAISEKMRAQIRGLDKASSNSQDAISLVQTAEGALEATDEILQRMREIAVQSSSDTNEDKIDRDALQAEFSQLQAELDEISEDTSFNNQKLLNGSLSTSKLTTSGSTLQGAGMTVSAGNANAGSYSFDVSVKETSAAIAGAVAGAPEVDTSSLGSYFSAASTTANSTAQGTQLNGDYTLSVDSYNKDTDTFTVTATNSSTGAAYSCDISAAANGANMQTGDNLTLDFGADAFDITLTLSKDLAALPTEITDSELESMSTAFGDISFTVSGGKNAQAAEHGVFASMTGASDVQLKTGMDSVTFDNGVTVNFEKLSAADLDTASGVAVPAAAAEASTDETTNFDGIVAAAGANIADAASETYTLSTATDGSGNISFIATGSNGDVYTASTTLTGASAIADNATTTLDFGVFTLDLDANGATTGAALASQACGVTVSTDFSMGGYNFEDVFGTAASTIAVKEEANDGLTIQVGANSGDELEINIDRADAEYLGVKGLDVSNQEGASKAIDAVNDAISQVSSQRAYLGAVENRLDYKIDNLETASQNLTSAESAIRDVDMAAEMTKFTNANILSQAATAMLAQANSLPQNVLSLLG